MKTVKVNLKNQSYPILIGRGLLSAVGRLLKPLRPGSKVLIVSNRKVAGLFLKTVRDSLERAGFEAVRPCLLRQGDERDKSKESLFRVWEHMAQEGLERGSAVLALGGGVVGDLAGFAASTYMRGISLVQVPTTLLAQVDSAIGGKTAIDLALAKNIIGTFYEPRLVIVDVETLKRMGLKKSGLRALRNSFAEIIKYGMIQDFKLFESLEKKVKWFFSSASKKSLGEAELSFLETVIEHSAAVKARVVEEDERETRGKRMILNYGHTFAHAFEAERNFRLPHGEAVALGMVCAARLARERGMLSRGDELRQNQLIQQAGLATDIHRYHFRGERVISAMLLDKKKIGGKLRFILPLAIGRVKVVKDVSLSEVRGVLR